MGCRTLALIDVLLATVVATAPPAATAAPAAGANPPALALLTIADGEVAVLRGRTRFVAAEGQRLQAQDIVHTAAAARVARLEFADGSVLDLGPATQVLLAPQGGAWPPERSAAAYLARGWAKWHAPRGAPAGQPAAGLASAMLDVSAGPGGVVLVQIGQEAAFVFVEGGRAQLVERRASREPRELALGEGHAYQRDSAAEPGIAALRPSAARLRATPRALADALPLRAARWIASAEPDTATPQPVTPGDVADWLETEPALRAALRARFLVAPPHAARSPGGVQPARLASSPPGKVKTASTLAAHRVAQLDRRRLADPPSPSPGAGAPIALEATELLPVQPVAATAPSPLAGAAPSPAADAASAAPAARPAAARSSKRPRAAS